MEMDVCGNTEDMSYYSMNTGVGIMIGFVGGGIVGGGIVDIGGPTIQCRICYKCR